MKKMLVIVFATLLIFNHSQSQVKYHNPILAGFYPDPSICRVGDDYYIVTSTFAYFPGLPVFHSTDLVNWKQIGHAMDRNEQLDQSNAGVSRGLFAPTIRYHNGTFYIICTLIDKKGNFIITAKDPAGPWSNPIWLPEVQGIDPSIFFDDDGKVYITYNNDAPDRKPLYDGHRTIRNIEYDLVQQKTVGKEVILVNGGVDISKNPIWIEAPHIYKIDGWYYLMCAEGGTGYNHSEVIFRSKNVNGPYEPGPINPILTQRDLDKSRKNPITTAGHADLVQTKEGNWYAVFLACRSYDDDYYNTGRETFLTPVEWKDGWPLINPGFKEIQYQYPVPYAATKQVNNAFSGNFQFRDDFEGDKLNERFVYLRNPEKDIVKLGKGILEIPLKPNTVAESLTPAMVAFRQSHLQGSGVARLSFNAKSDNEKAGLIIFQSEHSYYFLSKSIKNKKPVVELYKSAKNKNEKDELLATAPLDNTKLIDLKIEADNDSYSFYFSTGNNKWNLLKDKVDARFLSTKDAGGFVGCMFGLYATSEGKPSSNIASFDWFEYSGNDAVFK